MNNEYQQTVVDIAHQLMELSKRDLDPLTEKYGGDEELALSEFIQDASVQEDWMHLEEVALDACVTHNVNYYTLMNDVWEVMVNTPEYIGETLH